MSDILNKIEAGEYETMDPDAASAQSDTTRTVVAHHQAKAARPTVHRRIRQLTRPRAADGQGTGTPHPPVPPRGPPPTRAR